MAGGSLVPGAAPLKLSLENTAISPNEQDWLVQADHPWLGVEAVILSGALFEDCAKSQVSILYESQPTFDVWQQASEAGSPSDLDLSWKLLTWGPDALQANSWVASLSLQASGGNGTYVYFAAGDLASPTTGGGLLPDGRLVLEQAICVSALVQVGVTSAGQSYNQALPMQLVIPECR